MTTPILDNAAPLLADRDVVFCDIWGVVHDGIVPYAGAIDALSRFRRNGGVVILITNAPMPADAVAALLDDRRVPREAWDAIVTSGDLTLSFVEENGWRRVHRIAYDFDNTLFERLAADEADIADADAIVCVGMRDHLHDTPEAYFPLLQAARARNLPFVCANPDLVVDVGGRLVPCAGTLAQNYERMGGAVFWAGKPHPEIYRAAQAMAEAVRGRPIASERILAVGDSVRTDLKGADGFGIDAIFIGSGIHRDHVMTGPHIDRQALQRLLDEHDARPAAAMSLLAW